MQDQVMQATLRTDASRLPDERPREFVMDRLLSSGQVAKRLGVSVDVVRAMEARGELKGRRTPGGHRRYDPADVERARTRLRSSSIKPHPGPPVPSQRPLRHSAPTVTSAAPGGFGVEDNLPSVEELEAEAEREAAKERAAAEAKARTAAAEAERQRLEGLKQYGRDMARWALLPTDWQARVVEDLEEFVMPKRVPPSLPPWQSQQIVKSRVDGIINQYRDAEDLRRKLEDGQRRVSTLIAHGNNRAQVATMSGWDTAEAARARREVDKTLRHEVEADWSEADVDDRVDDVLAEWDDPDEDDEDDDEEEDDRDYDDDDGEEDNDDR